MEYYAAPTQIKYSQAPVYQESSATIPRALIFQKTGADNEPPKQVTLQQVLYEYQQTPHNAVSNVHVNQQFQTAALNLSPDSIQSQSAIPTQHLTAPVNPAFVNQPPILQVEPNQFSQIAAPVHHGAVIHHGQGYAKLLYGPITVSHTTGSPLTSHLNTPGKYIYANGKIVFQPSNNIYPGLTAPVRAQPLFPQRGISPVTQKPFRPSPVTPTNHNRFQVQQQQQQPIKAAEAPVREEVEDEDTESKSDVKEDEEEGDADDHSSYEEDDDDSHYSRYRFDEDEEEDDRAHYREEEEEDDDNTRSYSRNIRKKPKKYAVSESKPSSRYHKNDQSKYKEGYKTRSKYEYKFPNESSSKKAPKGQYKTYKYYKSSNNPKGKKEVIEGRQSQDVPIVHKQKMFHQEKWLVTKNSKSE